MTVLSELKEIKEMLEKIIRDMAKIRQTQKQMKEEMDDVKDDLRKFRELWKKEKAEIENRLQKLEEDKVKRELVQKLLRFEKMEEAIEMKEQKSNSKISKGLDLSKSSSLVEGSHLQKHIENMARKEKKHGSVVNIQYKKLCVNEKNMILRDGQRLIKQLFGASKTDL